MVGCQKLLSSDLENQESLTSLSGHKIKITVNEVIPFAVPFARTSHFFCHVKALWLWQVTCPGPQTRPGWAVAAAALSRSPLSQNSITLNEEAKVVTSDIVGVNGVIHFIDKILIPSDLVGHNISSKVSQVRLELCPGVRAVVAGTRSLSQQCCLSPELPGLPVPDCLGVV